MGYCIYITRADHPANSKEHPITKAEFKAIVDADDELEWADRGHTRVDWIDEVGDVRGRLVLNLGRIIAKNPTDELLKKMIVLAKLLGARVIGDEGEEYGSSETLDG